MVDIVSYYPEAIRLSAVALVEVRGEAERECIAQFSPLLSAVDSRLAASIKSGAFQKLNTAMLTTAMTLTSLAYPILKDCFQPEASPGAGPHKLLERYSTFWTAVLRAHADDHVPATQSGT
jgi:hypothetical protein